MSDTHLGLLFAILVACILLSAFFSGSETGLMALNRYRLRHLAEARNKGAMKASKLLERPDRLIGVILLGNNFVNILASSVATVIALELMGEPGIAVATGLLTLVILIFAEVAPKTLAALHPERVAFRVVYVLSPLLRVFYPVVWVINMIANFLLRRLGVHTDEVEETPLSREELRTIVKEAGAIIPRKHQQMLFGILDLEKVSVDDVMVPRTEIVGIDLDDDASTIEDQLHNPRHTRLPVYRGSIDNVLGILHVRRIPRLVDEEGDFELDRLESILDEPYYVPAGTPLHTQLFNFQRSKQRVGLVVDEYGDIEGLVTLEHILEEIVGEFTTDPLEMSKDVHPQADGSYLVDGGASLRELNRSMHWKLPTKDAKTLNGLILETLESIPEPGTHIRLPGYLIEIVQTSGQSVRTARVIPEIRRAKPQENQ